MVNTKIDENNNLKNIIKKYKEENDELKKLIEESDSDSDSTSDSDNDIETLKVEAVPKVEALKVSVQPKVVAVPKAEALKVSVQPKYTTISLTAKSMVELKDICRSNGIGGYSKYVKKDLIVFILTHKNMQ